MVKGVQKKFFWKINPSTKNTITWHLSKVSSAHLIHVITFFVEGLIFQKTFFWDTLYHFNHYYIEKKAGAELGHIGIKLWLKLNSDCMNVILSK